MKKVVVCFMLSAIALGFIVGGMFLLEVEPTTRTSSVNLASVVAQNNFSAIILFASSLMVGLTLNDYINEKSNNQY